MLHYNRVIIIISLLALLGLIQPELWAAEASLELEPVFWQYEESSAKRAGYAATPFASKANGWGIQARTSIEQPWGDYPDWSVRLGFSGILPFKRAEETWQLANSTSVQQNRLDIRQAGGRVSILHESGGWKLGGWGSYQWQQQRRREFIVNGSRISLAGEPVRETISTAWAGGEVEARFGVLSFELAAGVPAWVKVRNSQLTGSFGRKTGFQLDGAMAWQVRLRTMDAEARFAYRYRKLGGDLKSFGLWPDNRYQVLSAGVSLHW